MKQQENSQPGKKRYQKPTLEDFGDVVHNTKTDDDATMGDDISMTIMLWGDPS